MKITGNEPAGVFSTHERGLTIRQYFAAMAMQGFIASGFDELNSPKVAEWSVKYADDLIKELNKEK